MVRPNRKPTSQKENDPMAETTTTPTAPAPTWNPGDYWTPGQPIPKGAQVTPHEGGLMTLETKAPTGFDMDLREKALRQLDLAFERTFKEPSEEFPKGRRPYVLLVNPGFTHYFPHVPAWGELNPPCVVREIDGKDKRFLAPNAVKVGPEGRQIKALFDTTEPDTRQPDASNW